MNFIPGHDPELVFFDHTGSEAERHNVGDIRLDEVKLILENRGFQPKPEVKEDL